MRFTLSLRKGISASMLLVTASTVTVTGCASRMAKQEQEDKQQEAAKPQAALKTPAQSENIASTSAAPSPATPATSAAAAAPASGPTDNPRNTELGMTARLEAMEEKLSAMNDKLDATRASLDNFLTAHPNTALKTTGVSSHASDTVGIAVTSKPVLTDSESGYVNDPAIQQYRKAQILLDSQKYTDSILVFSNFLEHNPDHPLAGSAQFHIGEAYAKQKEWPLADQELQKVLTSYDRSIRIADTLRIMAEAEDHLGKSQEAARHRQQLTSLFANSPAAAAHVTAHADTQPDAGTAPTSPAAPAKGSSKPALDEPPPTAPVTAPVTTPEKNSNE